MKPRTITFVLAALLLLALAWLIFEGPAPTGRAGEPWVIQAGGELPGAPDVPPLPFSPYGSVMINGANISLDTTVSGWCHGEMYDETFPVMNAGETWYLLKIPGDDPETGEVEGCTGSEVVNFYIGPHLADQNASWAEGSTIRIDLTVLLPTDTPTPTPTHTLTPTPTPTSTPTPTPTSTPTPTGTAEPTEEGVRIYLPLLQKK